MANYMKHTFLKAGAALAMLMGSTAPVFAEETKNNPTNWTEAQEGDYNTYDTHNAQTNDKISGRAATTDHNGAVSDGKAGTGTTDAKSSKKSADLIYQVAQGYTWTIHSLVDFGDSKGIKNTSTVDKDAAIKVTRNVIPDGKKLSITLDPANDYKVHNGNTALGYTVANDAAGKNLLSAGAEVMKVAAGTNAGDTHLQFKLTTSQTTSEVAGDYKGTIGYVASIVDNK